MRRIKGKVVKVMLFCGLLCLTACGQENTKNEAVSPTPTLEVTNTVTPTVAPTKELTTTLKPTAALEPTATSSPTTTPEPTVTPEPTTIPTTDIPLTRENFPDVNFRMYLSKYVDGNQDWILTLEERETVTRIQNDFADYDKEAWWNDGNSDVAYRDEPAIIERCTYIDEFSNLQGIEYFPNLYEIQLSYLDIEMTELVITNPNLEIFDLSYQGNLATIDLTACKKLRTCVVDCGEEIKPEILLPEPLEVKSAKGYACVVGETAWEWLVEYYPEPTLIPPCPPEELPEEDYVIVWSNEKLEEAIREITGVRNRDIMLSDVYHITELRLQIRWLSGMSDLTHFKNLKVLWLGYSYITDISDLVKLKNLEELDLENNQIKDVSALAELPNLKVLSIPNNELVDISPLASIPNLTELNLRSNRVADLSPLAGLTKLEKLNVNGNSIENIDSLCGMESLIELEATFNQIEKVQLSGLPKLQRLDLGYNKIKEIVLSDMPELQELTLSNNNITDVSGLVGLENLKDVHLRKNPVENIEVLDFVEKVTYDKVEVAMPTPVPAVTPNVEPTVTPIPTTNIPLTEAYFPNENFRLYLAKFEDADQDGVLSLEEREAVIRIKNSYVDYDKSVGWNDAHRDTAYWDDPVIAEKWSCLDEISSLKGVEYFPNLYEIQLSGVELDMETTELVITNPNLEIFDLDYKGTVESIDLTACKNLRTCVIDCDSEEKPTILLPETLEVTPLEYETPYVTVYYDCVIGETARKLILGDYYSDDKVEPEDLPCEDYAIVWKDAKLEKAMRSITDVQERDIMLSDVYGITELSLVAKGISDITGLSALENLVELELTNNSISDISELAGLKKLTELHLAANQISDISPLAGLGKLEYLRLDNNQISDISALAGLKNMKELEVDENQISDISALAKLFNLESLNLEENQILDISPVAGLQKLRELTVCSNQITDCSCLGNMRRLSWLDLTGNPVENIEVLDFVEKVTYDKVEVTVTQVPTATPEPTPITDIPLTEEYFPDANFQKYLYEYADTNKDWVLTLEEREAVLRIQNAFADYDKDALWNEGYADVVYEGPGYDEYLVPLSKVTNLQGIEYFPNLYEIQLKGIKFDLEMSELVITNPKLEIFSLSYYGTVATIDLTACKNLRTCVVDCGEEAKPEILLPEPLEVTPLEKVSPYGTTHYDCVIGETAWDWLSGEY